MVATVSRRNARSLIKGETHTWKIHDTKPKAAR